MDREEESGNVCCQEIPACASINQESAEFEGITLGIYCRKNADPRKRGCFQNFSQDYDSANCTVAR